MEGVVEFRALFEVATSSTKALGIGLEGLLCCGIDLSASVVVVVVDGRRRRREGREGGE